MTEDLWSKVDAYIAEHLVKTDSALDRALETSAAAGLPAINVSPNHGKLLHILARLVNARAILEIGTLGGYSTIWMARALPPGGRLITLEFEPKHAELAKANIAHAGLSNVVDVRLGMALETLPGIAAENTGPFDLIFIDADKVSTADYFQWALKLARVGSLIVVDNVIRKGEVANATTDDPAVKGMRRFVEMAAAEPRVIATAIQTVGGKGYDGFSIALVTSK
ncbi:MAG TPA: O-methyltransferase [Vicinamibacterales bacterium]|jgi:predicted O-methyltransferase YrrM|nr:O-methyltransferase [Vicinamibacterales bacterium]